MTMLRALRADGTTPGLRRRPDAGRASRHGSPLVAAMLGGVVLLCPALPARANCWAGGDPVVRQLQEKVDTSPRDALATIDAALARTGKGTPEKSRQFGWLLATRTAALIGLLRYDEAEKAAKEGLALAGDDAVLRTELLDQSAAVSYAKPGASPKSLLDQVNGLRARLPARSAAAVCAANTASILQRALGDTEDAMRTAGDAYRTAKAARLDAQAAYIALNLSALILTTGDVEQSDDLAREAETWATRGNFTFHQLLAAFMRAQAASRGKPKLAAEKFLQAAHLARKLGVPSGASEQGACAALLSLRKLDDAEAACRIAERNTDPSDVIARTLTGRLLGDVELARGNPRQAIARYDALLAQAKAPALGAVADHIRESRAQAYAALGRYREAYADMKAVSEHTAARTNAQRARDLANARARFGWDRQRIANAELERDLARADARDQARRLWLWTVAGWAALLAAVLVWVVVTGKRHRRKLESLADEARALARTKADLLANMSHEIRSPLGSLTQAATRLAESPDIPFEGRQRAERLGRAGERLLALLEDLLLFSRIDARQLPISIKPFDPGQLMRETAALLEPKATAAGARLALKIDRAVPGTVMGDRNRLGQILTNLLDNAIKHSGATVIALSLSAMVEDAYVITVADNGKGIPADRRSLLFQRFTQVDGSSASRDGSGLGLAICKGLAELLGGEIAIEDSQHGLRLSVTMPVDARSLAPGDGLAEAA